MEERNADVLDQAAAITERERSVVESVARNLAKPETHPNFDGIHCVGDIEEECGAEIPAERLQMGRVRCVECQARVERRRNLYRR